MYSGYTFSSHNSHESGSKQKCWRLLTRSRGTDPGYSKESLPKDYVNGVKLEEVPFFKFEMLSKATGNFDSAFKLGQGGFGPVYKVFLLFLPYIFSLCNLQID